MTHFSAAVTALPAVRGAGANGSCYEHLKIHASFQGGLKVLAGALADLLAGEAPVEATQASSSGRCHLPFKQDSDIDIRPSVSPSGHWRAALRGRGSVFSEEVREAVVALRRAGIFCRGPFVLRP